MRLTASSEVPKYFTVVWQPVPFSNGVTQSVFGSLVPSSAYPGQARTLTAPSLVPSDFAIATSGALKPLLPVLSPSLPLLPQPAAVTSTAAVAATSFQLFLMRTPWWVGRRAAPGPR